jgi:hypothetical protein
MTRKERARLWCILVLGAFVVTGTGVAYRAFVDKWKGDVREPLIVAAIAGISFVVFTLSTLTWADRRSNLSQRKPPD